MIIAFLSSRPLTWLLWFALCVLTSVPVLAQSPEKPLLYSELTSTRAIALDASVLTPEPFSSSSSFLFGVNNRPRIMLFARALAIQSAEDLAAVTADAEDASHHHYVLNVEDVRPVPGQAWMSQIVLGFNENINDVGDVLIGITNRGSASNRVRIGVGHVGGGPADDVGALPTPAPPYTINGRVTSGTRGLGGALVTLTGPQTISAITDDNGAYSFTVTLAGNYAITLSKDFYIFTPSSKTLNDLSGNRLAQDFIATRQLNTISGHIHGDRNDNLDGISVLLTSSAADFQSRVVNTSNGGLFSFMDLPAGDNYIVTPSQTSIYDFTAQRRDVLNGDLSLSFTGTRRQYAIRGVVADRSHQGTGGVTVTLSGAVNSSATTDANGNYSFASLPAGDSYNLNVAKTDFIFEPQSRTYELLRDERADFVAIRTYRISGQVTDGNGTGLLGITMNLNGPEHGTVITGSDGSYSFILTTAGDYLLVPTKEQNFYTFTPSTKVFSGLNNNEVANFTSAFSSVSSPSYVLEFDGTPMTVDYSDFWPVNVGLGHFFWEFWAMAGENANARYLLSDGYGGTHALLFGFNDNAETGRYSLFGNIWDGSTSTYFLSDDGPSTGEWGHFAVGWDGTNIITYYDGVPVGKQPFAGPRVCMGRGWGASMPLIGGSDHQNLIGRIAQVRGYEGSNPREGEPEASFAPQTVFSREGQLLSLFFRSAQTVADLSSGYNSVTHPGRLRGFDNGYTIDCPACPTPKFVLDPTAPNFSSASNPGTINAPFSPAPPTPQGALIFDSFSRNNSTYILGGKGELGATESGLAGVKTWQTGVDSSLPQPFGILSGRAVLLTNEIGVVWVPTDSTNGKLDIRVDRRLGANGNGINTGLSFRVVDKNNFFFAYSHDDQEDASAFKRLAIGYYQSGVRIDLASDVIIPSVTWKTLRVVTLSSGGMNIYADNLLVYSTTSTVFATATRAGLYNDGPGLGLTNRWDNFTVLPAP